MILLILSSANRDLFSPRFRVAVSTGMWDGSIPQMEKWPMCEFKFCHQQAPHAHCVVCATALENGDLCALCRTGVPTKRHTHFLRQTRGVVVYQIGTGKFAVLGQDTTRRYPWSFVLFWIHQDAMQLLTPTSAVITAKGRRIADPRIESGEKREYMRRYKAAKPKPVSRRKPRIDLWRPSF